MGDANAATCEVCKISLDTPQFGDHTDVKISVCPRCRSEWECDLSSIAWFENNLDHPLPRIERIDVPVLRPDSTGLRALEIMTRSDEKPDFKFQIETTKALHQLMFNWAEVRRRILAALSLVKEIPVHPFILSLDERIFGEDSQEGLKTRISLQKIRATLEDNVERLDSLTEKTKALNSLVFNLANLHDSRAAVEEARAANAVATSLQRITSLTFVYLPITLAATIYGMNLGPITGEEGQKGIWAFFAVSAGLLVVTIGVLGIWIWKSQILWWFKHGRGGKLKVESHQQEKNIALAEP
ncbi:hypothetical protein TWF679_008967 [Orbilia oligospora]|uniref:Uncharacterized protein n=1 Tax=Orbilia oligospora TaxID=2813651 RepID=A0A8H8VK10_ORBOL|nr:hypothetical protein TWF679_008967 [Orbilia oligospora]